MPNSNAADTVVNAKIDTISPISPTTIDNLIHSTSPYSFFSAANNPIEIKGKITINIFPKSKYKDIKVDSEKSTTLYINDFFNIEDEILTSFFKSTSSPAKNIRYKNPSSATKCNIAWSEINAKYAAIEPNIISTVIVGSLKSFPIKGEENIIRDTVIIIDISSLIKQSYFSSGITWKFLAILKPKASNASTSSLGVFPDVVK